MAAVSPRRPRTRRRVLGPSDHGRRMSFEEFIKCGFEETGLYELARGIIVVTDIPPPEHGRIVARVWELFLFYNAAHPGLIQYQGGGSESRIRVPGMRSDRHPDFAVYLDPEPPAEGPAVWTAWVPHLIIEVVSRGSKRRDYVEKAEEYLRIGVREYWILDPARREMLVHRRVGDIWQKQPIRVGRSYRTPLLPGLIVRPAELLGLAPERGR